MSNDNYFKSTTDTCLELICSKLNTDLQPLIIRSGKTSCNRKMTLSHLTTFTCDDPIMDPWGLVSADFAWDNFDLGCQEKEREMRWWKSVLRNRSWLDKGWHHEGPLHTRHTVSLIILTRVSLFTKADDIKARCEEREEWKGALHLLHVYADLSSIWQEQTVPGKKNMKEIQRSPLCLVPLLAVFVEKNWTEWNLFTTVADRTHLKMRGKTLQCLLFIIFFTFITHIR